MPADSFGSGLDIYSPEVAAYMSSADLGSQHNAYEVLPDASILPLLSTSPRKEKENEPLPSLQQLPEIHEVEAAEPKSKVKKARVAAEGAPKLKAK